VLKNRRPNPPVWGKRDVGWLASRSREVISTPIPSNDPCGGRVLYPQRRRCRKVHIGRWMVLVGSIDIVSASCILYGCHLLYEFRFSALHIDETEIPPSSRRLLRHLHRRSIAVGENGAYYPYQSLREKTFSTVQ